MMMPFGTMTGVIKIDDSRLRASVSHMSHDTKGLSIRAGSPRSRTRLSGAYRA